MSNVDKPRHYASRGMEAIDAMRGTMSPVEFQGFLKGNVLKYVMREDLKNGDEDVLKAAWYALYLYLSRGGAPKAMADMVNGLLDRFPQEPPQ